jgi:hypothetical protein
MKKKMKREDRLFHSLKEKVPKQPFPMLALSKKPTTQPINQSAKESRLCLRQTKPDHLLEEKKRSNQRPVLSVSHWVSIFISLMKEKHNNKGTLKRKK